ncbi:MAG: hypothetical protein PVG42_08335 [Lysobacterales bacterium]
MKVLFAPMRLLHLHKTNCLILAVGHFRGVAVYARAALLECASPVWSVCCMTTRRGKPMKTRHFRNHRLLAGLFTCLALGILLASCRTAQPTGADILQSGFSDLRATAQSVIAEPSRRETYLRISSQLQSDLVSYQDFVVGFVERYREAFTDYRVDQTSLERLGNEFRVRQTAVQDRFVELHLAMAATVTPDEWKVLSRKEAIIIESLFKAAAEVE